MSVIEDQLQLCYFYSMNRKIGWVLLFLASILSSSCFAACGDSDNFIDRFISLSKSEVKFYYDRGYFVLKNVGETPHLIKTEFKDLEADTLTDIVNGDDCHYTDGRAFGYRPENNCLSPLTLPPGKSILFRDSPSGISGKGTYYVYVDGFLAKQIDFHEERYDCQCSFDKDSSFNEDESCFSGQCDIELAFTRKLICNYYLQEEFMFWLFAGKVLVTIGVIGFIVVFFKKQNKSRLIK